MEKTMNGMRANGWLVNDGSFIGRGEYRETERDARKREADFLIEAVDLRYTVRFKKDTRLKGRGIRQSGTANVYYVTQKALDSLKGKYTWETDF